MKITQKTESLFNSKTLLVSILLLVFVAEYFLAMLIDGRNCSYGVRTDCLAVCFTSILLVIVVLGMCCKAYKFSSIKFGRLFIVSLTVNYVSVLYALAFFLQLSWFADSLLDYAQNFDIIYFCYAVIFFVGMLVLTITFPGGEARVGRYENASDRKILFSGLSYIKPKPFAGLFSPFRTYANIEKFIIITTEQAVASFYNFRLDEEKIKLVDLESQLLKELQGNEPERKELSEEEKAKVRTDALQRIGISDKTDIQSLLKVRISEDISKIEGYEHKNVNIIFSDYVDYDNMDNCNEVLRRTIQAYEPKSKSGETIINVSPGTANFTAVSAMYAAKGDRLMLYTPQNNNSGGICKKVSFDVFTFEDAINDLLKDM